MRECPEHGRGGFRSRRVSMAETPKVRPAENGKFGESQRGRQVIAPSEPRDFMAGSTGLEPATSGLTGQKSCSVNGYPVSLECADFATFRFHFAPCRRSRWHVRLEESRAWP